MISLKKLHKHQGVALITVMLIVALCAVIASQMTARLQVQLQRSAQVRFNQQAYWYAMGAEAFTKRV
jgi:general secretion pathway protein K